MGLRFILGRAGTGKTHACLEEIQGQLRLEPLAGSPLILLVPEQASFQMEKALTAHQESNGIVRAQVMSFRRLGWLVFQEAGGTNRQYLDEIGKLMTLRSILLHQGENLTIYRSMVREQGFVAKLASTFKEFKSYNVTPDDLAKQREKILARETPNEVLAHKLRDLELLFREFEQAMDKNHTDPDDYLHLLAQRISQAPSLKEARIWVDSFSGFTPQELKVLGSLLSHCRQVNVTLCLDPRGLTEPYTEMDLFHPTLVTYEKLRQLAHSLGVELEPPKVLAGPEQPPRFANPALGFLESNYDLHQAAYPHRPEGLQLVRAANRRVEVEGVAREIIRLAREENYRYREMAVILRDWENYQELVATVFQEYQIPFFMDIKRPVTHHPLVELITAALETVNSNWSYEPLFRYLKTDLVSAVTRGEVDRLENYVLKYGIRGEKWLDRKPWFFAQGKGEEADKEWESLNDIRHRATEVLLKFHHGIHGGKLPVHKLTEHLFSLLQDLKVAKQLERWYQIEEQTGHLDKALEHKQIWDGVVSLMDQLVASLGAEKMRVSDYAKVVEAGLQHLKLGLIPPALDQVLVGSVERSRQPDLKGVFLIGLNEGAFPASIKEDEMFGDREREELAKGDLELAPTSKISLYHEQYLAYIAFTRASGYLWISYPEANEAGKELMPSSLILRIRDLFPQLECKTLTGKPGQDDFELFDYLVNPSKTIALLAERLQEAAQGERLDPFWVEVYHYLLNRQDWHHRLDRVLQGLFYENRSEDLEVSLAQALTGDRLKVSVSRLESFAQCPFKYFAEYGLGLEEREYYRVDALLVGNYYHQALEKLVTKIQQKDYNWEELSDEELANLTREAAAELVEMEHGILLSSSSHRYRLQTMEDNLQAAVKVLTEHARLKTFQPAWVEFEFGINEEVPAVEILLPNGKPLLLRGKIDRIDLGIVKDKTFLRVIDYKSSKRSLDLVECYYGLALQLPVYLDVALQNYRLFADHPPEPAGMFYFPVTNPISRVSNPVPEEEARGKLLKALRLDGWMLEDTDLAQAMGAQKGLVSARITSKGNLDSRSKVLSEQRLTLLRTFVREKLKQLALDINRGNTSISPYRLGKETACRWCHYGPCCQFDAMIEGNKYRDLTKLSNEELWIRISGEVRGGKSDEQ
ncbi:MAG: helicase-exonuclease AddAB subunit AddB [Clostridia bacterium]|nr:helicase-exonuclease AddAB subunit AddB [Clostridia bacterium]